MPGTFGGVWKQHRIPSSVSRLNRRRFDGWLRVLGAASRCDAATEGQYLSPPAAVRSPPTAGGPAAAAAAAAAAVFDTATDTMSSSHVVMCSADTARLPRCLPTFLSVGSVGRQKLPPYIARPALALSPTLPHARGRRPSHLAMAGSFEPDPDGIILAGGATISYFPVRSYPDPSPQAARCSRSYQDGLVKRKARFVDPSPSR